MTDLAVDMQQTDADTNELINNANSIDGEDILSMASYLTDNIPPESELRQKMMRRESALLDISGINLSLEETIDEFCAVLLDQNFPVEKNEFSLIYCAIGDAHVERLVYSLKMKDYVKINLSYNKLGSRAMASMAPIMSSSDIRIVGSLELDGNYLGPIGCQTLLSNPRIGGVTIQRLSLQGNAIGDLGILYICDSIEKCSLTLNELNVEDNGITDRGILTLKAMLCAENCAMKALNVSNNPIGALGAGYIGDILVANKSLEVLDIRHSQLGDIGIGLMVEGLPSNKNLKKLDVSDNDIGSEGAAVLFGALKENSGLESLRITRSIGKLASIGVSGGCAAADMLKVNSTLTSLE